MEKQEQTGFQKFLQKSLNVISFTVFIIAKAFTGSKEKQIAKKEESQSKLSYEEMTTLVKKAYGSVKNEVKEGTEEVKAFRNKQKRQFKTWGRVKQDFTEWYTSLTDEFDKRDKQKKEVAIEIQAKTDEQEVAEKEP